jgi:hypothetical protein
MQIISEIQCRVLSSRPRLRFATTAAEGRKRRAPAIPAALRRAKRLRGGAAPSVEPQARGAVVDFASHWARIHLPPEVAASLVLGAGGRPPEGSHDLVPEAGPYTQWGEWLKPANGAVVLRMQCARCGAHARDSTHWSALMRKRCGVTAILWSDERHVLAATGVVVLCAARVGGGGGSLHGSHHRQVLCADRHWAWHRRPSRNKVARHRRWVGMTGLWLQAAYGTTH